MAVLWFTLWCLSVRPYFFPNNSSYSCHRIALKLGGLFDHEVVQRMLFRGCSSPNFDSYYIFLKIFQTWLFPDKSYYNFHPVGLTRGGQLDYETMQCILFRGYSAPNCSIVISFPAKSLFSSDQAFICMMDSKMMWRVAVRLQYTNFFFLYSFLGTVHQSFLEILLFKASSLAFRLTPACFTSTS